MEIKEIKQKVFDLVGCTWNGEIKEKAFDGVSVDFDGNVAAIGYSTKPQFARGCTLLAKAISEGKNSLNIKEKPCFKSCGLMLDASRNGVMKVSKVKEYLLAMAALGLNSFMLYTEDTYELENRPDFGFLRGRYTAAELREIDDYADSLGIELIPCIQTLGHLAQYFKWPSSFDIRDTTSVLCANYEPAYAFVEECISAMRSCVRSKRIHIGMDEAFDLGHGQYLDRFGFKPKKEIITEHLQRVVKICEKYDFKPMMWSDMYFNEKGPTYSADAEITPEVAASIPDVELVFWDYYHPDFEFYDSLTVRHKELNKTVNFAGGTWTWIGFLPGTQETDRNTPSALKSAAHHHLDTVFTTMWGDDGCETNHFMALGQLAYYSEFCYRGEDASIEDVYEMGKFISGFDRDFYLACGDFHQPVGYVGKRIVYADILYGMHGTNLDPAKYNAQMKAAAELMRKNIAKHDKNELHYRYAEKVFEICAEKILIFYNVYNKYKEGDRKYFETLAKETLPLLKQYYSELCKIHKQQWFDTYKPFGFEVLLERYAATVARLDYEIEVFSDFASGKISNIEEFDANPIYGHDRGFQFNRVYTGCGNE